MSNLKSLEFEIGTVDDRVAFNINSKVPIEFPVVVTLRVEEALGMITALATAINQTLSATTTKSVEQ
jgi:hypothetical protein